MAPSYIVFCAICVTVLKEVNTLVDEPYMVSRPRTLYVEGRLGAELKGAEKTRKDLVVLSCRGHIMKIGVHWQSQPRPHLPSDRIRQLILRSPCRVRMNPSISHKYKLTVTAIIGAGILK